MIVDSITPAFSPEEARQYFEISTDGEHFTEASKIELSYIAFNKMKDEINLSNPLTLYFRKRRDSNNEILDKEIGYKINRILVNYDCQFPSSNLGMNVVRIGEQEATGLLLKGKFAEYDKVEEGSLNFLDFRMASIERTKAQLIFYAQANNMKINIKYESRTFYSGSYYITLGFVNNDYSIFIDENTTEITLHSCQNGAYSFSENMVLEDISFSYILDVPNNLFPGASIPTEEFSQTADTVWRISNINTITWGNTADIVFRFVGISATGYYEEEYGTLHIDEAYFIYTEPSDGAWTNNTVQSGDYTYYDHTNGYFKIGDNRWIQDWNVTDKGKAKTIINFEHHD